MIKEIPPLSLYIHIPWCVKKCPYCDFNSHPQRHALPEADYVAALIADLEQVAAQIEGRPITSIFFGGGTPSLFSAESIAHILSAVKTLLVFLNYDIEISLEANPGTVDIMRFAGYKAAGINRLSLGIQSFNNKYLQALGRIHDQKVAITAAELALTTFDNVNFDLMYGLPEQTLDDARHDAQMAVELSPQHLSFYQLTLEPNTAFYNRPPRLPHDDLSATMQSKIEELLKSSGYQHYETAAFAYPKRQTQHNLNYWKFGDYVGIGAGAHSKISLPTGVVREVRHKHPKTYMTQPYQPVAQRWQVSPNDLALEFMMNALRLHDGVPLALFEQRTGLPLMTIATPLQRAQAQGLLQVTSDKLQPTLLGQRFLNEILMLF